MKNELATKTFNVSTKFINYKARFVAPTWAQGFKCDSGLCGLCCLTEKPTNIHETYNVELDKAICGFYDIGRRICRQYEKRPDVCKLYPFFFGIEKGQMLISASLECPGTNSKQNIQTEIIASLFTEPFIDQMATSINDLYERAVLFPNIWDNADHVWRELTSKVRACIKDRRCFPFLQETIQLLVETFAELTNQRAPSIIPFSVPKMTEDTQGLYIATRFESYNLGEVRVKGSKTNVILFDRELKKSKKIKIDTPMHFQNVEMDKEAHSLLSDYISLLCNRPFLSLASNMVAIKPEPVPLNAMRTLSGSLVPIEVGATLITRRDNLKQIDRETMREIISFSEGTVRNMFIRPDRLHRR